ncbi:hypothetical protein [Labilibaculum filiforme]|nr:hypothetical protein [Labilibaculum filiforme]
MNSYFNSEEKVAKMSFKLTILYEEMSSFMFKSRILYQNWSQLHSNRPFHIRNTEFELQIAHCRRD